MQTLTPALAERLAARFRVLGDPARLRLLVRLRAGPATVGALAAACGLRQPAASRHLAALRAAGLVACRREGACVMVELDDPDLDRLCALMCAGVRRTARRAQAALAE